MRDRLINLIKEFDRQPEKHCPQITDGVRCRGCEDCEYNIDGVSCMDIRRAEYLLKNGVIVPPCKVGDTVYKPIITDDTHEPVIWEIEISHIEINRGKFSTKDYAVGTIGKGPSGDSFDFDEIGKTVFLTKEEAEQALKAGDTE